VCAVHLGCQPEAFKPFLAVAPVKRTLPVFEKNVFQPARGWLPIDQRLLILLDLIRFKTP